MSVPRVMRSLSVLVAALLLGALAGCSGGGSSGASGGGSAALDQSAGSAAKSEPGSSAAASGAGDSGATRANSARVLPVDRSVVYRGQLTVRVRDVAAAIARAESLVSGAEGLVFAEQSSRSPGRRGEATAQLTVKVPPTQFRPTLDAFGRLGRELSRTQSAEDVTTQVVDVASRLRSQRRSVARIQALLDRATTIGEIVRVEGELARREADLESLEAQQAKLDSLTDLATIDVTLIGPRAAVAPVEKSHLGFLSGLRGGWDAFVRVVVVALTVAGAVLPFLIVAALIGVPAFLVLRRRRVSAIGAPPAAG